MTSSRASCNIKMSIVESGGAGLSVCNNVKAASVYNNILNATFHCPIWDK